MAGGRITWSSNRQPTVALSTAEAEYISGARASQQASWLLSLEEVDLKQDGPVTLHGDNSAAVSLAQNTRNLNLVKHIQMRYLFTKEKVENGEIAMKLIRTGENVADIFTKALSRTIHAKWPSLPRRVSSSHIFASVPILIAMASRRDPQLFFH